MNLLELFGLKPDKEDKRIRDLVKGSYASVTVVGRGTISIDPSEVRRSAEFQKALTQAKNIVNK